MAGLTPGAVVALAGSAGCVPLVVRAIQGLGAASDVALFVVYHRGGRAFDLSAFLRRDSSFAVHPARTGMRVTSNHVYHPDDGNDVAVEDGRLVVEPPRGRHRPNIDRLLASLADAYGARVTAMLMSGSSGRDGVEGLARVREAGGTALVQAPDDALFPELPEIAIAAGAADAVLRAEGLQRRLDEICRAHAAPDARAPAPRR